MQKKIICICDYHKRINLRYVKVLRPTVNKKVMIRFMFQWDQNRLTRRLQSGSIFLPYRCHFSALLRGYFTWKKRDHMDDTISRWNLRERDNKEHRMRANLRHGEKCRASSSYIAGRCL